MSAVAVPRPHISPGVNRADRWISRDEGCRVGRDRRSDYLQSRARRRRRRLARPRVPLSVDGVEIVASLFLLADRRTGRRSGWLRWAALVVGTVGDPGTISRLI